MNKKEKLKQQYCSGQQKTLLIEIMDKEPELLSGKFSNKFTYKDAQNKWETISKTLNAIPGAKKSWKQWRKTWQDLRQKAKAKKATISNYAKRTGGGSPLSDKLTESAVEFEFSMQEEIVPTQDLHLDVIAVEEILPSQYEDLDVIAVAEESQVIATQQEQPREPKVNKNGGVRKRTVASKRLNQSLQAIENLSTLTKEHMQQKEIYNNRKLALLERLVKAEEELVNLKKSKMLRFLQNDL